MAHGCDRVFCCTVFLEESEEPNSKTRAVFSAVNASIRGMGDAVELCEIALGDDNVHPTKAGYAKIATAITAAVMDV